MATFKTPRLANNIAERETGIQLVASFLKKLTKMSIEIQVNILRYAKTSRT